MGLLDHGVGNDCAVLEHVLQVDQLTVADRPGNVPHIVDMDHPLIVGVDHILREDIPPADVIADLGGQVIPHGAVQYRVLIGVLLLCQLILMPEQGEHLRVSAAFLPELLMPQPVLAVVERQLVMPEVCHPLDHHVLNLLDADRPAKRLTLEPDGLHQKTGVILRQPVIFCHIAVCGAYGFYYFFLIERNLCPVPLYDFHSSSSSLSSSSNSRWDSANNSSQVFPRYLRHWASSLAYINSCSSSVKSMV